MTQTRDEAVPSGQIEMLLTMGELSDQRPEIGYEAFVSDWLAPLVAVFLRAIRDAALAYDLATETVASARLQWQMMPPGELAVEWVLRIGASVLRAAVEDERVPATERHRAGRPVPRRLSVAEQQEITSLAEQRIELPDVARDAADALARMAPPPHVLARLRRSDLVLAEPLPGVPVERGQERRGA